MTLKSSLKNRPVIYEIVPPGRDTSRFSTELRGIEPVLQEGRISAINIPELMARREEGGRDRYTPRTIPPEEYAIMIKDYKEPIVNVIVPRLAKEDFLARARKVLNEYDIRNLVLVGKEKHEDVLPGPSVVEALELLGKENSGDVALGGICIFHRESPGTGEYGAYSRLTEPRRTWAKAKAGCEFVTSQISFDSAPALGFLSAYRRLCDETGADPLTVFVSITTVPSASILSLVEGLDVTLPPEAKKRMIHGGDMGGESLKVAAEVFEQIVSDSERHHYDIPLGLQIEQVGVNSGELSLELLDRVYPSFR